jgi:energy-coupling factor transporter ATP-binding protein EcfA2
VKAVEHDAGRNAPGDTGGSRRGPLRPIELATAAVLGAMTVVLVIAGWFLPHASAITTLGAVPMGVVAYRHRPRAVVAAVVASVSVGFLVAGTGVISTIVVCGLIGGLAGHARQHRWGAVRLVLASAVLGPVLAAAVVGLLTVFSSLRKLTLEQLRNTWRGLVGAIGRLLEAIPGLRPTGVTMTRNLDHAVDWGIRNWWETLAVAVAISTVFATILAWRLLEVVFLRLDRVRAVDRLEAADRSGPAGGTADGVTVAPVPVELAGVRVRYPGAVSDALVDVDLQVGAGEMVAVLGPNGSGKSTLSRLLAGCEPTAGVVRRSGVVGLGEPGGTAIVSQRPESQVLGVRVADDLVWGLPRSWEVDTAALLADVGLSGMESRETSGLSGGQLQRLAVAAALARRPRLLISDESTAMIDVDGRQRLVGLLHDLPRTHAMTVVHVTHRLAEVAGADRIIRLVDGRVVPERRADAGAPVGALPPRPPRAPTPPPDAPTPPPGAPTHPPRLPSRPPGGLVVVGAVRPAPPAAMPVAPPAVAPLLRLRRVGHIYADGTPWRQAALVDIDLDVRPGDGLLVVGGNGSGKSTLAWILAGLLRPTFGDCDLDGEPSHTQVGSVAIAFQHARLQVQRSTVGRDVRAAGDVERDVAEAALRRVGLEPASLWDRSVDELSGGQLRRVALAGLLTRTPRVLVLDEPLAGLDGASRTNLISVLATLRAEQGLTLVVISHDLEGAGDMCDRVLRLRSGRISDDGPVAASTVGAR